MATCFLVWLPRQGLLDGSLLILLNPVPFYAIHGVDGYLLWKPWDFNVRWWSRRLRPVRPCGFPKVCLGYLTSPMLSRPVPYLPVLSPLCCYKVLNPGCGPLFIPHGLPCPYYGRARRPNLLLPPLSPLLLVMCSVYLTCYMAGFWMRRLYYIALFLSLRPRLAPTRRSPYVTCLAPRSRTFEVSPLRHL